MEINGQHLLAHRTRTAWMMSFFRQVQVSVKMKLFGMLYINRVSFIIQVKYFFGANFSHMCFSLLFWVTDASALLHCVHWWNPRSRSGNGFDNKKIIFHAWGFFRFVQHQNLYKTQFSRRKPNKTHSVQPPHERSTTLLLGINFSLTTFVCGCSLI